MATIAAAGGARSDRRSYQHEVERLLGQIRDEVQVLQFLKAAGVRAAALSDRKRTLEATRRHLASLVDRS
jgi:hypothetical protein